MSTDGPYEKAIEETAKTVGKAIDAGSSLGNFTTRVFGASLQELAGWSHDVIATKRLHWQASNIDQIMRDLAKLKQPGAVRPLPARQASVVLDAIANEDDTDLQHLWVNLLDSATNAASPYELKRVHIAVLRAIDPPEAKILRSVANFLRTRAEDVRVLFGAQLAQQAQLDETTLTVYLHHLASLGCFTASDKSGGWAPSEPVVIIEIQTKTADFQVTDLLRSLIAALRLDERGPKEK